MKSTLSSISHESHRAEHDILNALHDDVSTWKHFRVTGPICGEFTDHRWIPHTKASDAEYWCFLWPAPEDITVNKTELDIFWWSCDNCDAAYEDQGRAIASLRYWDVITWPCPWYLLLAHKSSNHSDMVGWQGFSLTVRVFELRPASSHASDHTHPEVLRREVATKWLLPRAVKLNWLTNRTSTFKLRILLEVYFFSFYTSMCYFLHLSQ